MSDVALPVEPETSALEAAPAAAPSSAIPEADRLFAPPTPEQAARALRDLAWGEQFVATRVSSARGPTQTYLYSLEQMAVFLSDEHAVGASVRSRGSFTLIDLPKFIAWIRDVIEDEPLAGMLEECVLPLEVYNDQVEELYRLLMLRMAQYQPYLPSDEDE